MKTPSQIIEALAAERAERMEKVTAQIEAALVAAWKKDGTSSETYIRGLDYCGFSLSEVRANSARTVGTFGQCCSMGRWP